MQTLKEYTLEATPVASAEELKNRKGPKAKRIAIGTDTHLRGYQAARKVDNAAIGAVANLRSETELLLYVEKQREQAEEVVVAYEAGPLGYGLYRKLTERGVKCLVCVPDSTQQQKKRRKNNQIDARTLTSNLFNYLNGNEAVAISPGADSRTGTSPFSQPTTRPTGPRTQAAGSRRKLLIC